MRGGGDGGPGVAFDLEQGLAVDAASADWSKPTSPERWWTGNLIICCVVAFAASTTLRGSVLLVVLPPVAILAVAILARTRRLVRPAMLSISTRRGACRPPLRRAKTANELPDVGVDWLKPRKNPNRRVTFDSKVPCVYVRDLSTLSPERKAAIWWQQDDFDGFLSTRVEIAKAYRAAAKKLGLDIMQLSSISSYGDTGYRAMIKINPKLCNESRRGLGFGRSRQRAQNRDKYIAAVLGEQRRQRKAARGAPGPELDAEAVAKVARRVSEKDRLYAHWLAESYYRRDREADTLEERQATVRQGVSPQGAAAGSLCASGSPVLTPMSSEDALPLCRSDSDLSAEDDMEIQDTFSLNDTGRHRTLQRQASPQSPTGRSTKGFGLSVDRLREAGLASNGHNISRYQKLRTLGQESLVLEGDDSEALGADSDCQDDDCSRFGDDESAAFVAEYRQWRMGAPVRAGRPGFSEVKTYGTRREYRAWRSWQRPPDPAA